MKEKIITTGLNGLVGSKFEEMFADQYEFLTLGRSQAQYKVDVTDMEAVEAVVQTMPEATTILHMAAFTDVTTAFEQTDDKTAAAYQVNVVGTQNLVEMAKSYHKKFVLISTAYVFDGQKDTSYTEEDQPNPIEWYGKTKLWAEEAVLASGIENAILRIDQPFRLDEFPKKDVAHKIIAGIKDGSLYPQFNNHFFGPTFVEDFARVLDWVLRKRITGIWHASSGEKWSDFDFSQLINQKLKLNGDIKSGDLDAYLASTARPYQRNTAMNCDKLKTAIDFELMTVAQAISELATHQSQ